MTDTDRCVTRLVDEHTRVTYRMTWYATGHLAPHDASGSDEGRVFRAPPPASVFYPRPWDCDTPGHSCTILRFSSSAHCWPYEAPMWEESDGDDGRCISDVFFFPGDAPLPGPCETTALEWLHVRDEGGFFSRTLYWWYPRDPALFDGKTRTTSSLFSCQHKPYPRPQASHAF